MSVVVDVAATKPVPLEHPHLEHPLEHPQHDGLLILNALTEEAHPVSFIHCATLCLIISQCTLANLSCSAQLSAHVAGTL